MNLRNIKYIVVHCTATPTTTTLESIKRYWKEQRGWGDTPGYHYFIKRDGTIVQLLDEKKLMLVVLIKTESLWTTAAMHKSTPCSISSFA